MVFAVPSAIATSFNSTVSVLPSGLTCQHNIVRRHIHHNNNKSISVAPWLQGPLFKGAVAMQLTKQKNDKNTKGKDIIKPHTYSAAYISCWPSDCRLVTAGWNLLCWSGPPPTTTSTVRALSSHYVLLRMQIVESRCAEVHRQLH